MNTFRIEWRPLAIPRVPIGVVAFGPVARCLVHKLQVYDDNHLESMQIAAGSTATVILGDAEQLPWVAGVSYVGRDARAPNLYLPTHSEPQVPVDLLATAIRRRISSQKVVVSQTPLALLPVESSQVLRREVLEHWLEER